MIPKDAIERMPTAVREPLYNHFTAEAERENMDMLDASFAFMATEDPAQRTRAIESRAKAEIYRKLAKIFK